MFHGSLEFKTETKRMMLEFRTSSYLRKATLRAKSDVANKLVSMCLHEISRKISVSIGLSVIAPEYLSAVDSQFGIYCCYCARPLESDRVAIEHPDGMNRFRAGLHIPGNVIISCKKCNNEKRRDDQANILTLANSGWESFLSHDATRCNCDCKTVCTGVQYGPTTRKKETICSVLEEGLQIFV